MCCAHCFRGETHAFIKPCPVCKYAHYCSRECMLADAPLHQRQCRELASLTAATSDSPLKTLISGADSKSGAGLGKLGALLLVSRCLWRRHEICAASNDACPADARGESTSQTGVGGGDGDGRTSYDVSMFDALERPPSASVDDIYVASLGKAAGCLLPPGASPSAVALVLGALRKNQIGILDAAQDVVAAGVYVGNSMLNHSCAPNCALTFDGRELLTRTLRRVGKGEELLHSYVELCRPTRERQEKLDLWGFSCDCERCTAPWASAVDKAIGAVNGDEHDAGLLAARSTFDRIGGAAEPASSAMLREAREALPVIRDREHSLSLERYGAESLTMSLAEAEGDTTTALGCGRAMLAFLEAALGHTPAHPLLSMLRHRVSELLVSAEPPGGLEEARHLARLSVDALLLSHGADHDLTREAAAWLEELTDRAEALGLPGPRGSPSDQDELAAKLAAAEAEMARLKVQLALGS